VLEAPVELEHQVILAMLALAETVEVEELVAVQVNRSH
jgi:hypothetical protein